MENANTIRSKGVDQVSFATKRFIRNSSLAEPILEDAGVFNYSFWNNVFLVMEETANGFDGSSVRRVGDVSVSCRRKAEERTALFLEKP